ncbi:hypothetical protein V6N12_069448 [Hibiscus sabdariffa]|uniref:Uncharacterized protein n=1 Tax=Hibiscus sabdariffa TaxID=183260 RepID=A0ABR2FDX0_9ROSI
MGTLIKGSMEEYIEEEGLGKGGKWSFGERSTTADGKNKSGGHGKVEGKTRRGNEEEDDHVPGKRATYQGQVSGSVGRNYQNVYLGMMVYLQSINNDYPIIGVKDARGREGLTEWENEGTK